MLELTCLGLELFFERVGQRGVGQQICNDVAEETNTYNHTEGNTLSYPSLQTASTE